jgi:hypothetical protein
MWLILVAISLILGGCSSYMDLGNGKYERTISSQDPVMFGVSHSDSRLEHCVGYKDHPQDISVQLRDCELISRHHGTAPGWFPQLLTGLLNFAGMGWIASNVGGSASANANSNVVVGSTPMGGHGGGHH